MQRKGIGTFIVRALLSRAKQHRQSLTLAVTKINPAFQLYQRLGFRITHADEYKL